MAKKSKSTTASKPKRESFVVDLTSPSWTFDEDRKWVTLKLSSDPHVSVKLDVTRLAQLQETLGAIREKIVPEVSRTLPQGDKIKSLANPFWVISSGEGAGDLLLHLRDPRYGWLHYLVPKSEGAKLLAFLQRQVS
jgi:hypothetical protein